MRKVLDYSSKEKRYLSHDFNLISKIDKQGYVWKLSIHHPTKPNVNDFILMALNHDDIRIGVINTVKSCGNPSDMYIIQINIKNAKKKFDKWKIIA